VVTGPRGEGTGDGEAALLGSESIEPTTGCLHVPARSLPRRSTLPHDDRGLFLLAPDLRLSPLSSFPLPVEGFAYASQRGAVWSPDR
jgi:hypothetical protein